MSARIFDCCFFCWFAEVTLQLWIRLYPRQLYLLIWNVSTAVLFPRIKTYLCLSSPA